MNGDIAIGIVAGLFLFMPAGMMIGYLWNKENLELAEKLASRGELVQRLYEDALYVVEQQSKMVRSMRDDK